jgi:flagellar biosynthesis chaperone FliJ
MRMKELVVSWWPARVRADARQILRTEPDQPLAFDLEDAIELRCEMDRLNQQIQAYQIMLEHQASELNALRIIADQASCIWNGRAARDRLFVLVADWQETWGKYQRHVAERDQSDPEHR